MNEKHLISIKWLVVIYICVSLLSSYVQINMVKDSYIELARNSKMIVEHSASVNKAAFESYIDSAVFHELHKLPSLFLIAIWQMLIILSIVFIYKCAISCTAVAKKKIVREANQ